MNKHLNIVKIKEGFIYTKQELLAKFSACLNTVDEGFIVEVLKHFKAKNIVKYTKALNKDDELTDISNFEGFKFDYVGLLEYKGWLLEVFPKYVLDENTADDDELSLALQCIVKYKHSKQENLETSQSLEEINPSNNMLDIMLFMMFDYYENGLYFNQIDIIELNGDGPTLWDKTVDELNAYIINGDPIYLDTYNQNIRINDNDFFARLHRAILTYCSQVFENAHLFKFLTNIEPINLSSETIDELGDKDYILEKIIKEKNIQFNTRKQYLLDLMYNFIDGQYYLEADQNNVIYGTTAMNLIWEDAIRISFGDCLDIKIDTLKPGIDPKYNGVTPRDIIPKPNWKIGINNYPADSLIPDTIKIMNDNFIILDAKYYVINATTSISGQPGIDSITKQYIYQLMYKDLINDLNPANIVSNFFILPSIDDTTTIVGDCSFTPLNQIPLVDIQILYMSPRELFKQYLTNKSYSDSDIKTLLSL